MPNNRLQWDVLAFGDAAPEPGRSAAEGARVAKARRTQADRDRERSAAEQRAWEEFRPKLAALQTYEEALQLVAQAPPPDSPGRRYYSNLGFFLQSFTVPMGSNGTGRSHYIVFINRLEAAGALKPGAAPGILTALRRALAK